MAEGRPLLEAPIVLRDAEYQRLQRLVGELTGIHLGPKKHELATGRLLRRLRALGLRSFEEYLPRVSGPTADSAEQRALVNSFTTNKTDFFRESHHFDFMTERLLPALLARTAGRGPAELRFWSAGCSTGEEPYSIAMTVLEALAGRSVPVRILASDIDTDVLAAAARGVYDEERVATIPAALRVKYLLRGVGRSAGTWRVSDDVRKLIEWKRVNLTSPPWPVQGSFDAIFCRNVLIYFDRPTQTRVVHGFTNRLGAQACLFLGHSEGALGAIAELASVGPTVHSLRTPPAPIHRIGMGEIFASAEPAQIVTVLGSCLGVCLFDAVARVGGMSHFVTPGDASGESGTRAGAAAIPELIGRIVQLGGQRGRLQAKLVGAASVVSAIPDAVPEANLRFGRELLAAEGIRIVGERVGGLRALEAHFFTHDGRLRCRVVGGG